MAEAIWKAVDGYEGQYEVSDRGHVRSLERLDSEGKRVSGRVLSGGFGPGGHPKVSLWKGGVRKHFYVHTLVLEAFVGPRPEFMEACHEDGCPTNNHVSNLRWDSRSANVRDSVEHKTHNESRRTECDRGHLLEAWNLVAANLRRGKRTCKACTREYARARKGKRAFDNSLADKSFIELAGENLLIT